MSSPFGPLAEAGRAWCEGFQAGFNDADTVTDWQPSPFFWDTIRRSAATLEIFAYPAKRSRFVHAHKPKVRVW